MTQTVIGIFKNSTEAQNAKEYLLRNGFSPQNVDVSAQSAADYTDKIDRTDQDFGDRVSNFFKNLFGDSEEATNYSRAASRGVVVTVHAQNATEAESAADILDDYGAVDVNEYASAYGSSGTNTSDTTEINRMGSTDRPFDSGRVSPGETGMDSDITDRDYDRTNPTMDTDTSGRTMDTDKISDRDLDMDTDRTSGRDETRIPIIEENLNVGKEEVVTGGKRIHSRIVERPVEETIRLREEHVNIERNPVDRPASDQDMSNFKEGTIEVTEHAEIPVVDKDSRVVEEVNVFKDVDEKQEVIRETLRNTEVETDDIKARNTRSDDDHPDDADHDHHSDDTRRQRPGII